MKVLVILAASLLIGGVRTSDADYSDQAGWGGVCNLDASKKQSPVDVLTPEEASTVLGEDEKIVELSAGSDSLSGTNSNAGTDLKIAFGETVTYNIPGLDVVGTVAQFHIHWGKDDEEGSEHLLDGKRYQAEGHLVTSYGDAGNYAVLNRFFKVGAENAEIAKMIASQKASGADRAISEFNLAALYPDTISSVITYSGGLTTPDCDEIVHWVIVPEPLTISAEQLVELRTLALGDGTGAALTYNWRNAQDLNDREFTLISSATTTFVSYVTLALTFIVVNFNF